MKSSTDKIVFIENEDINRNSSGGIMSYILNLSSYFMSQGYKTMLIGSGKTNKSQNAIKNFYSYYSVSQSNSLNNFIFFTHLFITNQLRHIRQNDIIHVQRAEMVVPIAFRKRNKIICTLHGGQDLAVLKKKGKLMALVYSIIQLLAFILVDKLIVVDKKNLDRYVKKYPWIRNKISMIPISINIDRFHQMNKLECRNKFNLPRNKKILLFIGRLEYEKNVEFIISSFQKLQNNQYKLIIAGNGSLREELEKIADRENNDIDFLGEVRHELIPELINSADLLLLTSFFEGSPTVVKEALCCQVPVVATDVGDVKEVLDLAGGGIIIDLNAESFMSAANHILLNENFKMNPAGRHFSHVTMGEKTFSVYEDAIQK